MRLQDRLERTKRAVLGEFREAIVMAQVLNRRGERERAAWWANYATSLFGLATDEGNEDRLLELDRIWFGG